LKYFICALGSALDKINVGIPAQHTERIIPVTRIQDSVSETENQEVFISLPALLRQKDRTTPHGIVLKSGVGGALTPAATMKTILLTPRIDAETEIPEEDIHSLPKVLTGMYRYFRGAYCTDQNVILILAPEKLMECAL